ncbi:5'-nucleotidase C-terminal domain-containing protein [Lactococcus termiticola]|uniref:5'-nucleotidase n=1 Tax=Lactococcus termiticola TaxID=2169526 RepID=A0A2R5HJF8_9LACT|nr:5'-nucleotidase C-terminal domain-containing protein [Lactococcus termiticola]GBG96381.1 5'-nucleotidase [Lactococcus termiticola]
MKHASKILFSGLLLAGLSIVAVPSAKATGQGEDVYRLYNTASHAHLWTKSSYENSQLPKIDKNWRQEGIGWQQVKKGSPVYRVYNHKSGEHHYTQSAYEKSVLVKQGWRDEGVALESDDPSKGSPVYRLYNPKAGAGAHHLTTSSYERDQLIKKHGWKDEGIGWYAASAQSRPDNNHKPAPKPETKPNPTPAKPPVAGKPEEFDDIIPVQILGINDLHGNLDTTNQKVTLPAITGDPSGRSVHLTGGAARLAGYLNGYTANFLNNNKNGISLRFEAGDMIGASPGVSSLIYDQPTIAALKAMQIHIGTLGNHEFDRGLDFLEKVRSGQNPVANPTSNIDKLASDFYKKFSQDKLKSDYPLVIANLENKSDGSIPKDYKPYAVLEQKSANGKTAKIGVIGVVTPETKNIVLAEHVKDYNFTDPAEAIAKYSKELRKQGINAIVVLGHTSSNNVDDDPNKPVYGETADIIKKLDQIEPNHSVDLYLAGHSHTFTNGLVGKTRVVQALSYGKAFDNVIGKYDTKTNDFSAIPDADIVPTTSTITGKTREDAETNIPEDPAVLNIVNEAKAITGKIIQENIGAYPTGAQYQPGNSDYLRRGNAGFLKVPNLPEIKGIDGGPDQKPNHLGETLLGQFITKAHYETAKEKGQQVDLSLTNNGGIRADLAKNPDGSISWGQAQAVQPFRNVIQIVEMTGQEIIDALNEQTLHSPSPARGSNHYLHQYGLKYEVTSNPDIASGVHPNESPYVVSKASFIDGRPLELDKSYRVSVNSFLRGGGDGFEVFTRPTVKDVAGFQLDDTDIFIDYIKKIKTLPEGKDFIQSKTFDGTAKPLTKATTTPIK